MKRIQLKVDRIPGIKKENENEIKKEKQETNEQEKEIKRELQKLNKSKKSRRGKDRQSVSKDERK